MNSLAAGPEGGFTEELHETDALADLWRPLRLGIREIRARAEGAGRKAVGVQQYRPEAECGAGRPSASALKAPLRPQDRACGASAVGTPLSRKRRHWVAAVAHATPCCLPLLSTASALRMETFRGSMLRPRVPLSTLRRRPHGCPRMTRGHRDWLGLRRTELASATTCRSPGARRGLDDRSSPSAIPERTCSLPAYRPAEAQEMRHFWLAAVHRGRAPRPESPL